MQTHNNTSPAKVEEAIGKGSPVGAVPIASPVVQQPRTLSLNLRPASPWPDQLDAQNIELPSYLGIKTKYVSSFSPPIVPDALSPDACEPAKISGKISGFDLQNLACVLLPPDHRLNECLRAAVPGRIPELRYDPSSNRAYFKNLRRCGRIWLCSPCASKVSERRYQALDLAVKRWQELGGFVLMATFTLRHGLHMSLAVLLAGQAAAWRYMTQQPAYRELLSLYGLCGSVRAKEITVSPRNGWHPHLHVLFFAQGPRFGAAQLRILESSLLDLWGRSVRSEGMPAINRHGVDVRFGWLSVAEYISKFGRPPSEGRHWNEAKEVTKSIVKLARSAKGQSPFGLLAASGSDPWAREKWLQYADAIKGSRHLVRSDNLVDLVGLGPERSDEEEATAGDPGGELVHQFVYPQWKRVLGEDLRQDLQSGGREFVNQLFGEGSAE